ncbi:hypothetical protein P153DRAFT_122531 [Dothidotthia symphoricarpi CBS 119687]|uniref:Uncharacterized protein n=1 Tax=Dothidotthia symphoricarpi CBS 119687 TaxID=1392245 RepID=A0A6A6A049_9PLEO|nr:uncharacterized protein P153DRAFT_122531 [Dothidotthia symphoricarpi CBS 119687]KAF2125199.1 hypothetical protein P153DRAFT_122531 [Dothidotthia symphoricarpi CBS 119687]
MRAETGSIVTASARSSGPNISSKVTLSSTSIGKVGATNPSVIRKLSINPQRWIDVFRIVRSIHGHVFRPEIEANTDTSRFLHKLACKLAVQVHPSSLLDDDAQPIPLREGYCSYLCRYGRPNTCRG